MPFWLLSTLLCSGSYCRHHAEYARPVHPTIYSSILCLPLQDHWSVCENYPKDYCVRHAQVHGDLLRCSVHLCCILLSGPEGWGDCQHVHWGHYIRLGGIQSTDPVSCACDACMHTHRHTHTSTHTHTNTRTYTHAHARTHTHTHTVRSCTD